MMASWQVPLMQPLNPWVQGTPTHQPTLHVIDFSKLTKHRCRLMLPQHFFQIFTSQLAPCIQLDQEAEEKEGRGGVACR